MSNRSFESTMLVSTLGGSSLVIGATWSQPMRGSGSRSWLAWLLRRSVGPSVGRSAELDSKRPSGNLSPAVGSSAVACDTNTLNGRSTTTTAATTATTTNGCGLLLVSHDDNHIVRLVGDFARRRRRRQRLNHHRARQLISIPSCRAPSWPAAAAAAAAKIIIAAVFRSFDNDDGRRKEGRRRPSD